MMGTFEKDLGGNAFTNDFQVEGIAILIPFSIGDHRDTLNCNISGMNTVVAIHTKIKITNTTLNPAEQSSNELQNFLNEIGYTKEFPCSVILYSRKICHSYSMRMAKMYKIRRKDQLREMIFWALHDRVGDIVDYNGNVLDNDKFGEEFYQMAEKKKESRFQGLALRTVAGYTKCVSTQLHIIILTLDTNVVSKSFIFIPSNRVTIPWCYISYMI